MEVLPTTIQGARILILGFGRVGKLTALRCSALGARVSVAARSCADLAWARAFGCDALRIDRLGGWLGSFEMIINTVPALILGERELTQLRPDCYVLDLASKPGGVDCIIG